MIKGKGVDSIPDNCIIVDDMGFAGGMVNADHPTKIRGDEAERVKNFWYDYRNALTKIPGLELYLTETNNQFAVPPIYQMFNFVTSEGQEKTIVSALNSGGTMKIWMVPDQSSYPANTAVTDITPSIGIAKAVKPCFFSYRGYLYMTNGTDPLMRWDNGVLWEYYLENYSERFRYGTVFDNCMFLASSIENPNRLAFTIPNGCYPLHYYTNATHSSYAAQTYYIDIPSRRGGRITGILNFMGFLIIYRTDDIWAIFGSPVNDTHSLKCLSEDKGCVDGDTAKARGDHVFFKNIEGIGLHGNTSVVVSREDQKLKTNPNVSLVTRPIQPFWDDYITIYKPADIKTLTYSASDLNTLLATLTNCAYRTTDTRNRPPHYEFTQAYTLPTDIASYEVTNNTFVDLRSTYDKVYSQSIQLGSSEAKVIGQYVLLYLKLTGTGTSSQKLNVYLCDGQASDTEPNNDNSYAEGQITGDYANGMRYVAFTSGSEEFVVDSQLEGAISGATITVKDWLVTSGSFAGGDAAGHLWGKTQSGTFQSENLDVVDGSSNIATIGGDTTPVSTGCWIKCDMDYHDYPQPMRYSDGAPVVFLQAVPEGDTESIYFSWSYHTTNTYTSGRMYNSDPDEPANQSTSDYNFIVYGNQFNVYATLQSDAIAAGTGFVKWGSIFVGIDTNTFDDYVRRSELSKIEYALSTESYATWYEVENGGDFPNIDDDTIKVKITFNRKFIVDPVKCDSFLMLRLRLTYWVNTDDKHLHCAEIYKDRYITNLEIQDPDEVEE